ASFGPVRRQRSAGCAGPDADLGRLRAVCKRARLTAKVFPKADKGWSDVVKAESVGLSRARLERLDRVMKDRYVDAGHLPGIVTQVYRKGEIVHTGLSGHMDLERDKPMREDAIFRIYSMTKPITAVALMMLVEEGLIGLDDNVHTHIPSWKRLGVYASGVPTLLANQPPQFMTTQPDRPMKVVDLVTHTSGLTYGFMMRTSVD